MRRFIVNRWWTCILALLLGVAGVVTLPRASFADDEGSNGKGMGEAGGGGEIPPGTSPDPQGAGDPDSPSSSGKTAPIYVGGSGAGGHGRIGLLGTTGVGDAKVTSTARMWLRVRFALGMFKYYYLRY